MFFLPLAKNEEKDGERQRKTEEDGGRRRKTEEERIY